MAIVGLSLPLSALCSAAVFGIQGSLNVHLHLLLHLAVDVTPEWQPKNLNSQPLFHGQSPVTKKIWNRDYQSKKGFKRELGNVTMVCLIVASCQPRHKCQVHHTCETNYTIQSVELKSQASIQLTNTQYIVHKNMPTQTDLLMIKKEVVNLNIATNLITSRKLF